MKKTDEEFFDAQQQRVENAIEHVAIANYKSREVEALGWVRQAFKSIVAHFEAEVVEPYIISLTCPKCSSVCSISMHSDKDTISWNLYKEAHECFLKVTVDGREIYRAIVKGEQK